MGISFQRSDQLKPDVVWGILGNIVQSNATFSITDRLELHLDHIRMPAGKGKMPEKTKWRSLDVLRTLKKVYLK